MGCISAKQETDSVELQEIYKNKCEDIMHIFSLSPVILITTSVIEHLVYNINYNTIDYYIINFGDVDYVFSLHGLKRFVKTIYTDIINIMPKATYDTEKYNNKFLTTFFYKRSADDYFKRKKVKAEL